MEDFTHIQTDINDIDSTACIYKKLYVKDLKKLSTYCSYLPTVPMQSIGLTTVTTYLSQSKKVNECLDNPDQSTAPKTDCMVCFAIVFDATATACLVVIASHDKR